MAFLLVLWVKVCITSIHLTSSNNFLPYFICFLFVAKSDVGCLLDEGSLSTDGHMSWTAKAEDKDKEHKRENDGAKDKERCKDKYMFKSIQELDLSNCQRCTPSYRLLPDDVWNGLHFLA